MENAMNPSEWLNEKAPGFRERSLEERDAAMHFALLWSLFEARHLNENASVRTILSLVQKWQEQGKLDIKRFSPTLDYFKARCFIDGQPTGHLDGLHLRQKDSLALVQAVLSGANTDTADNVSSLLIVVYRLRNNFFHGRKWAYELRDQLDNFSYANSTLMATLEIAG